ncbi:MAG: hypothetical protein MJZ13_00610 [Bacteroidales bacterium]|nr:hypothetical protein [Bacteroidales bacterium]
MKKFIISLASLALAASSANAQLSDLVTSTTPFQVVGAGMRVGVGSLKQEGFGIQNGMGVNAGIDGVYTYYFKSLGKSKPFIGVRSGLGVSLTNNNVSRSSYEVKFSDIVVKDKDKDVKMSYQLISSNIDEKNTQIAIEVPIMGSVLYKQLYGNLGVRIGIPVVSKYKITMDAPTTVITLEDYGVTINDSKVLGGYIPESESSKSGDFDGATFNLSLAFEGGYVFEMGGNWLCVGAYFDYGLVNNFSAGGSNLVDVDFSPLSQTPSGPATVSVNSLTQSHAEKMGFFDVGVRATYSWPMIKSGKSKKGKK